MSRVGLAVDMQIQDRAGSSKISKVNDNIKQSEYGQFSIN